MPYSLQTTNNAKKFKIIIIDGKIEDRYSPSKIASSRGKLSPRSKRVPWDISVTPSGELIARAINMYLYVSGVNCVNLFNKSLVMNIYRFNDTKKNIVMILNASIFNLFKLYIIRIE
jgi:hypothetical protein